MNELMRELSGRHGLSVKPVGSDVYWIYRERGELTEIIAAVAISGNVRAVRRARSDATVYLCWGDDQARALLGVLCA